jgi:hypothetical protein
VERGVAKFLKGSRDGQIKLKTISEENFDLKNMSIKTLVFREAPWSSGELQGLTL